MALYSDLLFAVSGDPIDVRASIYKNIATSILEVILTKRKHFLVLNIYQPRRIFWPF
jgi:hypothetical protein